MTQENGFKETEIGLIPNDWEVIKLGDCIDTKKGRKPETLTNSFEDGFEPYLTADYFRTGNTKQFINVEKEKNSIIVDKEDIVLIWDGSNAGDVFTGLRGILASTMVKIIPTNNLTRQHLFYFLKTKFDILNEKTTGSTIPHVSKSIFEGLPFVLPPLIEQQKITFVLSKIQQAIEQQDKIIKKTKELKRSLMQRLFTYGLRGEELKETEIGLMPESWDVVRLGDDNVLEMVQYGISVRGKSSGKYPILRMNSIVGGYVVAEKLQYVDITLELFEKFSLEQGDILFNRTNSIDLVGKTGIFNLTEKYTFASYLIRLRTNKRELNSEFLNLYLNLESSQERLKTLATRGVSQSNISGSRLKTLCIPLPPDLDEQKEIAHILLSVDKKLFQSEARKQILQSLFKSMLQLLMTGQVRVKDIDFGGVACE